MVRSKIYPTKAAVESINILPDISNILFKEAFNRLGALVEEESDAIFTGAEILYGIHRTGDSTERFYKKIKSTNIKTGMIKKVPYYPVRQYPEPEKNIFYKTSDNQYLTTEIFNPFQLGTQAINFKACSGRMMWGEKKSNHKINLKNDNIEYELVKLREDNTYLDKLFDELDQQQLNLHSGINTAFNNVVFDNYIESGVPRIFGGTPDTQRGATFFAIRENNQQAAQIFSSECLKLRTSLTEEEKQTGEKRSPSTKCSNNISKLQRDTFKNIVKKGGGRKYTKQNRRRRKYTKQNRRRRKNTKQNRRNKKRRTKY